MNTISVTLIHQRVEELIATQERLVDDMETYNRNNLKFDTKRYLTLSNRIYEHICMLHKRIDKCMV